MFLYRERYRVAFAHSGRALKTLPGSCGQAKREAHSQAALSLASRRPLASSLARFLPSQPSRQRVGSTVRRRDAEVEIITRPNDVLFLASPFFAESVRATGGQRGIGRYSPQHGPLVPPERRAGQGTHSNYPGALWAAERAMPTGRPICIRNSLAPLSVIPLLLPLLPHPTLCLACSLSITLLTLSIFLSCCRISGNATATFAGRRLIISFLFLFFGGGNHPRSSVCVLGF